MFSELQLTTELILGVWGAVLSTVAIGWNLIRAWLGRTRLQVSCDIRDTIVPGVGVTAQNQLYWNIVNAGSIDIVVTHVCGEMKEKPTHFMVPDFKPIRLRPGDSTYCLANEYPDLKDIASLFASDSLGRHWKAPRRCLKNIRSEIERQKAAGEN